MIALDNPIYIYHDPISVSGSVIEWVKDFGRPSLDIYSSIVLAEPEPVSLEGRRMISKIKTFRSLKPNWDSYGAVAPSARAIEDALSFVRTLDGKGEPVHFAAPGPDGQVLVELNDGDRSVEITFSEDEPTSFAKFSRTDCVEEGELTPESLSSIMLWLHS
jgi:hypothetical protein